MSDDGDQIAIDHEILLRSAETMRRVSGSLAQVSLSISGAPISAEAFGLMNTWMIAPIAAVSANSAAHVRVTGDVVDVIANATDLAAHDFERTEEDVLLWVTAMDEQLGYSIAPPPEAPPSAPGPVPSPTPNAAPTPPAESTP